MKREKMIQNIRDTPHWDVIIIGGGATGLGTALDAATRGYSTLLVEQLDFAKGTSSRSTKLVHGGVRYLAQGNLSLVMHALKERGRLLRNAPHLAHAQQFIVPVYSFWTKWFYFLGLAFYDFLSIGWGIGRTRLLSKKKTIAALPLIKTGNLKGGIQYTDGQFDDSRLCIDLAATAHRYGATVLNYAAAASFTKNEGGQLTGVVIQDHINGEKYTVTANAIINATGVFAHSVMEMDDPEMPDSIAPSQGVHLVIDMEKFQSTQALMVPKTTDGRVLFAVPWHHKVIVGTTDTPVEQISTEPKPLEEEIQFIIDNYNIYASKPISMSDVKSVYVGLRPLVRKKGAGKNTSMISRDHTIMVSASGLITITGGKWTTYRRMAADVINHAIQLGKLTKKPAVTATLPIGKWGWPINFSTHWHLYGTNARLIQDIMKENKDWATTIHPDYPYTKAEVIWFVRHEMAQTVEDVLARRIRLLLLDAHAALEAAPAVAYLMQQELSHSEEWKAAQILHFSNLAKQYIL
ncbi:MAG: glycerol-3-phosphate dehydrogenase/oxidase [Hydrotalea sp. AMD]|uniref:glycerol-3-phosphate dehydrogenase/oxidase n=1 Tax=Hydrotalea sp. AMD TaxID=2501297 RepID=UPI0009424425|nr:glycerol-3-phosphate dehydrogenase/oxidase [Hydrotalea sp. AMD]RWZ87780.1 MAG: glycerol-3-phosphate dehydrogenase/oxidase [Hydrotalea sp. AMD]